MYFGQFWTFKLFQHNSPFYSSLKMLLPPKLLLHWKLMEVEMVGSFLRWRDPLLLSLCLRNSCYLGRPHLSRPEILWSDYFLVGGLPSGGGDRDAASHMDIDQPPRRVRREQSWKGELHEFKLLPPWVYLLESTHIFRTFLSLLLLSSTAFWCIIPIVDPSTISIDENSPNHSPNRKTGNWLVVVMRSSASRTPFRLRTRWAKRRRQYGSNGRRPQRYPIL